MASTRIRVTILGSGTCVPSLHRSSPAVLVRSAGAQILLDIGPGTIRRLLEADTRVFDISHVVLSHFHPDHSADLAPFLFANKYPDADQRTTPLTLIGGPGFLKFWDALVGAYGHWIDLSPEVLTLLELGPDTPPFVRLGDLSLTWVPTVHRPESIGIRLEDPGGHSLVYSGDTDQCSPLETLAEGVDLLICEAALPDALKVPGHLTPSLAGAIAAKARAGQLVLTHFYPPCDQADMAGQCRRTWTGPLRLAEDLMTITLT